MTPRALRSVLLAAGTAAVLGFAGAVGDAQTLRSQSPGWLQGSQVPHLLHTFSWGNDVALSADGLTALVGAQEGAWIFRKRGQKWTQVVKFNVGKVPDSYVFSVALSANGKIALVGTGQANGKKGAAWIFSTSGGGVWVGSKLPAKGEKGDGWYGWSVALSANGAVALVGAPKHDGRGGAWVFARSGTTWKQQGSVLSPSAKDFGTSVALSGDGSTALIGGPRSNGEKGTVWLYTSSGSTWTFRGQLGTFSIRRIGKSRYGSSVALSQDGKTALIGGAGDASSRGAAWVFQRTGGPGQWAQQAKLTDDGQSLKGIYRGSFGRSVALPPDGNTALVGSEGAVWVFTRSGSAWKWQAPKVWVKCACFGESVAISADANTALIGAPDFPGTGALEGKPVGSVFEFFNKPEIRGINPFVGPMAGGTRVIIVGSGFSGARSVLFVGSASFASFRVDSPTQITAVTTPHPAGTTDVRVTNSRGASASAAVARFTYLNRPSVTAVTPASGPPSGGTQVLITGTALSRATMVKFGATATSFKVDTDTEIRAEAPPGQGTVDVTVITPGGTSPPSPGARFTYGSGPNVTALNPSSGPAGGGTQVTITGTDLGGATAVRFGTTAAASFTVDSSTQIRAVSPPGQGTVDVTVTTPIGTSPASSAARFTYVSAPAVTAISPGSGPIGGGTQVTITGVNFTGATAVRFGGTAAASFTVDSSTQIRAVSPPGQNGTVDVTVTTPAGTSAASVGDRFTYFTVISFDNIVTGGPGGTLVTVNTQYSAQGVTFNDLSAIDYSKGTPISGFAHSGTVAVESCIGEEFCTKAVMATFAAPQRTVCAWIGFYFALNQPLQVELRALDAGSAVVGTASATLPANSGPTLIRTPLQVTVGSATITQLRVLVPGGYNNALAVDDVVFTTGPGPLSGCS